VLLLLLSYFLDRLKYFALKNVGLKYYFFTLGVRLIKSWKMIRKIIKLYEKLEKEMSDLMRCSPSLPFIFHGNFFIPTAQRIVFHGNPKSNRTFQQITHLFFQLFIKFSRYFNHFPTFFFSIKPTLSGKRI